MRNKYFAHKTKVDGITFDSHKESFVYQQLLLMQKAKKISKLLLQPEFVLQQPYTNSAGIKIKAIKYRADFSFYDHEEKCFRVVDVKGFKTAVYKLKKKMFDYIMRDSGLYLEESIGRRLNYGN